MIAKKPAKTAPRERSSPQNGTPEFVPYAYRQQKRRRTGAAQVQPDGIPKTTPAGAESSRHAYPASDELAGGRRVPIVNDP